MLIYHVDRWNKLKFYPRRKYELDSRQDWGLNKIFSGTNAKYYEATAEWLDKTLPKRFWSDVWEEYINL